MVDRHRWLTVALALAMGCGTGDPGESSSSSTNGSDGGGSDAGDDDGFGDGPAPGCPDPGDAEFVDGLVHLGRARGDTFIEILDVVADGTTVFSCTATQGLTVWDATDGTDPLLMVENVGPMGLAHPSFPRCQHLGLDLANGRAVITNRGDEVQPEPWLFLYDVSDPANPVGLRGWTGSASIEGAILEDSLIYAAAHSAGILVFEDQGGANLVQVGSVSDPSSDAWQVLKVGDVLYSAEGTTGLRVYDVGGANPQLLSTLALPGSSKDLIIDGTTLYIAGSSALVSVDVTDPSNPVLVGETPTVGTALAVTRGAGNTVLVAEWDEVRGYDISDPANMTMVVAENVPTADAFSRVLALDAVPSTGRMYAGEWTGMHAYEQNVDVTAPEIFATPGSVQFGSVDIGDFDDGVLVIRNSGNAPLVVFDSDPGDESVTIDPACFEVPAGAAFPVEVRYAPVEPGFVRSSLLLATNDPDEPTFPVSYSGNIPGLDVGDPAPDFTLQDLDGVTWTKADLEGNVAVLAYFATF